MTNQTPTTIHCSPDLTVIFDGTDTGNSQIGMGDHNAEQVHPLCVTKEIFLVVEETADGGFHVGIHAVDSPFPGPNMTTEIPAGHALTFHAILSWNEREAIANGIAALVWAA